MRRMNLLLHKAAAGSQTPPMNKPRLSFWQMYNMSFGFLGIQFGWGLQLANMSAVYERLGARSDQVPLVWLAAPPSGAVVQPIVRVLSGPSVGRVGRRRSHFPLRQSRRASRKARV